ncbi:MAG: Fic family protein [Clostridia bacterium]|nr:Fic family protein [Clostridia bacterium]
MRGYSYTSVYPKLLTPEIVSLLLQIREYKGEQTLFIEAQSDSLTKLVEIAKIQSTEASNKIEGIFTSDDRLKKILLDKTMPSTRDEQEIAGYRDVLNTIHQNHDYIPLKPNIILQLHRDLYKFSGKGIGGNYKTSDNVIAQEDEHGNRFVRFAPVPAWEAAEALQAACTAYDEALRNTELDPLLLIPMFILDFLCIHPFGDGNGRMSRLLTLLLLYRSGYIVGKYISIEKLIEQTKETYYDALMQSSANWHEGANSYLPFVRYMLGMIVAAQREFSSRVHTLTASGLSKPDRIRELIRDTLGKITKKEIMEKCPDISQATIQRTLNELQKNGEILKLSGGRYAAYTWNREND